MGRVVKISDYFILKLPNPMGVIYLIKNINVMFPCKRELQEYIRINSKWFKDYDNLSLYEKKIVILLNCGYRVFRNGEFTTLQELNLGKTYLEYAKHRFINVRDQTIANLIKKGILEYYREQIVCHISLPSF